VQALDVFGAPDGRRSVPPKVVFDAAVLLPSHWSRRKAATSQGDSPPHPP
jgi:hypothetical protein